MGESKTAAADQNNAIQAKAAIADIPMAGGPQALSWLTHEFHANLSFRHIFLHEKRLQTML